MRTLSTTFLAAALLAFGLGAPGAATAEDTLTGAGATFPYPLYAQWADSYKKLTGIGLNYQSIGSGGGIAQIKAKTVDFGASDAPLKKDELDKLGLVQFPMIMGGVVPVVNLKGLASGSVKLSAKALADIFLGTLTKWNDPALVALNPGVALPDQDITVVHRADGSGTTWIFTNYLDKVSPDWHAKAGCGKEVAWPAGVGGKGNEGVAAYVQRIPGSIGYVEYAYALQNKLAHALLQNKAGAFVAPTDEGFQAAAASADWAGTPGFAVVLTDQPGAQAWPITGASFILMYKEQRDAAHANRLLDFFAWSFKSGDDAAKKLDYVPLPDNVVAMVEALWRTDVTSSGAPIWK
jgi:phosphate transport system substrate-binding protein